ncbi:prephenate dehydratase [Flavobacteriaceae bacterium]|nr:prephenate dehydratase [Flavobacteriaceae bacterium]
MQSIIAIQGIQGSFHHQVALNYFPTDIQLLECLTFDALADALVSGKATQAVMAIENSIAGSIIPNYALLDRHNLQIIGESYLNIEHNLMGLKGQSIADLKEVHSHPMALLQCKAFFSNYPHIRLVEAEDTADIARKINKEQLQGIGAIASVKASDIFNLELYAASIQTIKNNVTRFVIIQAKGALVEEKQINKAALKFVLDHQRGSLAAILNVMSDCQLNLTKIQSLPVIETPGKYAFFVDVTFDTFDQYKKAQSIIEIMATEFKILGEYPNNKI